MVRADRASQFAPFAALKGYEDALRAKELVIVERSELSEEMLEYLDYKLSQVQINDIVTVIYYENGGYLKKTGMVSKINTQSRFITVVTTDISFENIKDIQI